MELLTINCTRCGQKHNYNIDENLIGQSKTFNFACLNIKRLPRVTSFRFDFSSNLPTSYEKEKEEITFRYGIDKFDEKINRRRQINKPKMWFIHDFDQYFEEIINSYISGSYYPVATSCTTLAERLINLFILKMRDFYDKSLLDIKLQKYVYERDQNWQTFDTNIKVLQKWSLLNSDQKKYFDDILSIRNKAVHFQLSFQPQSDSLIAIKSLYNIIDSYFSSLGRKDLLRVFEIPGEIWVREDMMDNQFVKAFVLPCCNDFASCGMNTNDGIYHENDAITGSFSEAEFIEQRKNYGKTVDNASSNYKPIYEKITFHGKELRFRII